jgi:predicted nuclease of predicted toxin-antitoxin system
MVPDTKDPVIAFACSHAGHVLVTHDKDFRDAADRLGLKQRQYRTRLHRILLRCPEPLDVMRLKDAVSLIEAEWLLVKGNRPMFIEIFDKNIRVWR